MIAAVDQFVFYDDMQYTRRDWRNRNQIKTPQGVQWLTVPVKAKGKYLQTIRETEIEGTQWAKDHWQALSQNYRRAPFFNEISSWIEPLYLKEPPSSLSQLNRLFIQAICDYLGIKTALNNSWDFSLSDGKSERLADLCVSAGASEYISGPAARDYIDESVFAERGVKVSWFDYAGYSTYPQLWGEFTHGVTILDLLFNCGKDSRRHMRYVLP
jgi:WbqC-like protein family